MALSYFNRLVKTIFFELPVVPEELETIYSKLDLFVSDFSKFVFLIYQIFC